MAVGEFNILSNYAAGDCLTREELEEKQNQTHNSS